MGVDTLQLLKFRAPGELDTLTGHKRRFTGGKEDESKGSSG
jgi:hypothetical protein